jgi:hypothetical protein
MGWERIAWRAVRELARGSGGIAPLSPISGDRLAAESGHPTSFWLGRTLLVSRNPLLYVRCLI